MKCSYCGAEMEEGTVKAFNRSDVCWNEFTSHEEAKKTGWAGFLRKTIAIPLSFEEQPAWHCPHCKKVLMWADSKE